MIHALQQAPAAAREHLAGLLAAAREDPEAAREAAALAERLGGRDYARDRARRAVAEAQRALRDLPASDGLALTSLNWPISSPGGSIDKPTRNIR